jgi:hypothetical protein
LLANPQIAEALLKSVGQLPSVPVITEAITHYVRPTIQGLATGGVKKFVGSRQAAITMPIKKSYSQYSAD